MQGLTHTKHSDIDFAKWDAVVLSSRYPLVFAQSFYLNATSPGWSALVLDNYKAIFPITSKSKYGITYLPQPPFTSQLGLYGNYSVADEELFIKYILDNYKLIEIELNAANKINSDSIQPKNTFIIDYSKDYNYNQNTKRNIAKANNSNFRIERIPDEDVLIYSKKYVNAFLANELKLPQSHINLFDQLLVNTIAVGKLYSFKVVNKDDIVLAIGHFICNGKHTLYLKGTNFDKAENTGSMHFLMSYAIDYFADKSIMFDFGGGSNSKGLATFYEGFGGERLNYSFLRVNNLPWPIKWFKNNNSLSK